MTVYTYSCSVSPSLFDPPSLAAAPSGAAALETLHPALWRAHQLGRPGSSGCGTGFATLDAELPGGGWPVGTLTELLLPHPGVGEMRLLAPALAAVQRQGRSVMLLAPPAQPCAWAWQALGLALSEMVVVQAGGPGGGGHGDLLWALEHALRSGHLGAVLAWLPARLPVDALRRLQLAAQPHDGPAFLLRGSAAAGQFSPATLRCLLEPAGHDTLQLHLLKRRGPPREAPLSLALPPVLTASARVRARGIPALPSAARQAPVRLARL